MDLEKRVNQLFAYYENKLIGLLKEMQEEVQELVGLEGVPKAEVFLGDARKAAILTESLRKEPNLRRAILGDIARQFGRKPAGVGVYFRDDVGLMRATGVNLRVVTDKGKEHIKEWQEKFGEDWIDSIRDLLSDEKLPDSTKVKLKLRRE